MLIILLLKPIMFPIPKHDCFNLKITLILLKMCFSCALLAELEIAETEFSVWAKSLQGDSLYF
jgi:hypothetical protein